MKRKRTASDRRADYYHERVRPHGERYKEFDSPSAELLFNLLYTYDVAASCLGRDVARHGLSLSAFNVLMILRRSEDEGCALHELSDLLLVSRANITGLVDCLEQRGLIERGLHEGDRRVRIARLTKKGEQLLESLLPVHYAGMRGMCAGLTNKEKAALSELLAKLRKSIQDWENVGD